MFCSRVLMFWVEVKNSGTLLIGPLLGQVNLVVITGWSDYLRL